MKTKAFHDSTLQQFNVLTNFHFVQKKFGKVLTVTLTFGIFGAHTVTKTQHTMRTKTLLAAAAALAAGLLTSQAAVTSANVVGYANVSTPNGGTYLLSVPFNIGVSNGANEVWPLVGGQPSLPDGSTLLIWNGAGYDNYLSDSTSTSLWDDAGGNPIAGAPVLPVGKGFFLVPAGNVTNVFAGAVSVSVGTSNSMVLPNGGTYLVGASVPYAGAITNGTSSGGGVALSILNGLPDGSTLLIWNGAGYDNYLSDSTSPSLWDDAGGNPIAAPPSINVGQGFFIVPAGDFTWHVGL